MLPTDNDGEADIGLYGNTPKNDAKSNKSRERSLEVAREASRKWSPRKAKKSQSRISGGKLEEYGGQEGIPVQWGNVANHPMLKKLNQQLSAGNQEPYVSINEIQLGSGLCAFCLGCQPIFLSRRVPHWCNCSGVYRPDTLIDWRSSARERAYRTVGAANTCGSFLAYLSAYLPAAAEQLNSE